MSRRYAIYFAPPEGSALEAFGRGFLGRDHVTGEALKRIELDGWTEQELSAITRSARHYGFHATLKAPFALTAGRTAEDLYRAADAFAAERRPFEAPPLEVSALSRWVAFTLSVNCPEMDQLAADCVRDFEPLRASLDEADIERRRESGLTTRQDAQLLRYGYPYIFEDFHFHMTLAGPLEPERRDRLLRSLRPQTAALESQPLHVDAIAVYEQPDRDSAFVRTGVFPFRQA